MNDLEKAKALLDSEGCTCVLVKGDEIFSSSERGVLPLLKLIDSGNDFTCFSAADKVVGKAAAFLYAHMKIDNLFARVISERAIDVLETHNINVSFDKKTPSIKNRAGDGICPMETAVENIADIPQAITKIREKLKELMENNKKMV